MAITLPAFLLLALYINIFVPGQGFVLVRVSLHKAKCDMHVCKCVSVCECSINTVMLKNTDEDVEK